MKVKKPLVLIILDGWGMASKGKGNAIVRAKTPVFDRLLKSYPWTTLATYGKTVGLPKGLIGNSEAGHINMGAGRVVEQDLTKINRCIKDGTFFQNSTLLAAMRYVKSHYSCLHLMGILSDGGAHGEIKHIYALLELAKKEYIPEVFIHLFSDGRDTSSHSALKLIDKLEKKIEKIGLGKIASICGRYYAMDRTGHWERIKKTYNMIAHGRGDKVSSIKKAIQGQYKKGITDEFISPSVVSSVDGKVKDSDAVIFFNLRSDRARQIAQPFILSDFDGFSRGRIPKNIFFVGFTSFGDDLPMLVAFPQFRLIMTLPETLSKIPGFKQLYITEEEKFAPLTYFFHGGTSLPYTLEERIMIPSVEVSTYDEKPEMSAFEITKVLIESLKRVGHYNFVAVNYANPDMLGHTGNIKAAILGIEAADKCLGKLVKCVLDLKGTLIVTADHGNAEEMINPKTGEIETRHSKNPVPFIIVTAKKKKFKLREGILANVAPTILKLLNLKQPKKIIGKSLLLSI